MGRDFKKIKVWQIADKLTQDIYRITRGFPAEERYGITSQLRRAALSVPTNVAEGCERKTIKEYLQFLYVARGSLSETEYLLYISNKLHFLSDKEYQELEADRIECIKTLSGLIAFITNDRKV
jgi:four helix bundle protein